MGRRPYKFSPNWLSARQKRILRDASDQRSRYIESTSGGEFDDNHLSMISSGDDTQKNETTPVTTAGMNREDAIR
jgi:hypothetical protein